MSGEKPKVYQGVRVKVTVRQLLQEQRALQAQKPAPISQSFSLQDVYSGPLSGCHFEACTDSATPEGAFHPRRTPESAYGTHKDSCGFENAEPLGMMLHAPSEIYSGGVAFAPGDAPSQHWATAAAYSCGGADCWSHGMAHSCTPEPPLSLPCSEDFISCSPPQYCYSSSSSSSSSCYSSPVRADAYSLQHYSYCAPHWSPPDSFGCPEYTPYFEPSDCMYSTPENCYSTELCYL